MLGGDKPHRFLQTPAGAVTSDRIAEGLAGGKTETGDARGFLAFRPSRASLQHKRGGREASALSHREELSPGLETSDCRHLERAGSAAASLSRKALAPLGSAPRQHLASALRRHPRAETVPALADEPRWLIGALHGEISGSAGGLAAYRWRAFSSQSGASQALTRYHDAEKVCFGPTPLASIKERWQNLSRIGTEAQLAG